MSKSAKKKTAGLLLVLAAAAGVMTWYNQKEESQTVETAKTYKEEKVKYGSVSVGITESGSVSFGTLEQIFEIAEVTVTGSSSDSSEGSSNAQSSGGAQSMAGGQGMAPGGQGMGGMSMGGMGGMSMGGFDTGNSGGSSSVKISLWQLRKANSASS